MTFETLVQTFANRAAISTVRHSIDRDFHLLISEDTADEIFLHVTFHFKMVQICDCDDRTAS